MIERTYRGVAPKATITAPDPLDHLRDNRDLALRDAYFAQSAMTTNGQVPSMDTVREQFETLFPPKVAHPPAA